MRLLWMVPLLLLSLLLIASGLPGCRGRPAGTRDLGRACEFSRTPAPSDPLDIVILETAHEGCLERVCHKQGGYLCADGAADCVESSREALAPVCTRRCRTREDCASPGGDANGCRRYVCQAFGVETGWDGACGCVCLDAIRRPDGQPVSVEEFEEPEAGYGVCGT